MSECTFKENCRYFKEMMASIPATANMVQSIVCKTKFDDCARYQVRMALGVERVPEDLSPSDVDRARLILANA